MMATRAPLTNAQRQARYRQRRKDARDLMASGRPLGDLDFALLDARIDVRVSAGTKRTLAGMARRHGLTQRAMLEAIINDYSRRETAGLDLTELIAHLSGAERMQKRRVTTVTNRKPKKSRKA